MLPFEYKYFSVKLLEKIITLHCTDTSIVGGLGHMSIK